MERKIKIWGVLLIYLLNVANGYMFEGGNPVIIILRFVTILIFMIIQWEGAYYLVKRSRKRYPNLDSIKQRVIFAALCILFFAISLQLVEDFVLDILIDKKPVVIDWGRVMVVVLQSTVFTFTAIALFEGYNYFTNYSKSEKEKEELLRANLQSRFDSLKGQVNPHFLFNSLNSLSSLIRKDALKAEQFVEQMADVYRYLLHSNERELIPLEEELNFIYSYLHLLNTRFGPNLQTTIQVDEQYNEYLIPPLTLQLLVENAVKHNVVSADEPLFIKIFTTHNEQLHVVNNLQKKPREVISGKIGLGNIVAKYRLMKQPEIEIKETDTRFIVIIPLIKSVNHERIHH